MKFIYLTITSFFLLNLTHAAPAPGLEVDLDLVFVCEILPDNCPTAVLKALESIPVNDIVTVAATITAAPASTVTPSGI
jgi:hypothetical protein